MTKTTLNSNVNYEYTYDHLGRLNYYYLNLGANEVLVNPVYYASERNTDNSTTYQTTQIQREEIGDRAYSYTYDDVGNILTIRELKSGASSYVDKVSYTYDALGQLKTEINVDLGQKIIYTYDNGGNITSKSIYAYTNGTVGALQNTVNYTYDETWKDKLTGYTVTIDGETAQNVSITYDEIGNPEDYRDNMSFTWNGRQMATANLNGTTVEYKYDADGLRNYKKVGNTVHEYEYVGGQLVYEKRGDLKFYYRYNAMGELASIKRINSSGTEYTVYVVTNTRGDVEELRLANGSLYARYVYDSWGNVLHVYNSSGSEETNVNALSLQNPFRYRSYYYDAESGLYYLQSRYYDPVTCRFLNSDSVLDTSHILGFNVFAYCANNPVVFEDTTGFGIDTLFDIVSVGYSAYQVWKNPKSVENWLALGLDVLCMAIPFASGGGAAARTLSKTDELVDAARTLAKVDDVYDAAHTSNTIVNYAEVTIKQGGEIKKSTQIKSSQVIDAWDDFLGLDQTNVNKFTGKIDPNRIFSSDGTKSIRFNNHEMDSLGTPKAHFHYEKWVYDPLDNTVTVFNELQRIK